MSVPRPSAAVLSAFDVTGEPTRLAGGRGGTWRAGGVVLKRSDHPLQSGWIADVLAGFPDDPEVAVARPVRARDGDWLCEGWEAWHAVPGRTDPTRFDDVLAAGEAFHRHLGGIARPAFLDDRDDPWTTGERIAWDEEPLTGDEVMIDLLEPLAHARRPVDAPGQPVHGDLLGNVLFAAGARPTVIDWAPYFRPAAWAAAVAVIDALTWHAAPADLAGRWAGAAAWDQMLVRALMYRIATNEGFRRAGARSSETPERYRPVVDLVLARCGSPVTRTPLRHNPANAVTATVDRITYPGGRTGIRKELRPPDGSTGPWSGSADPRHWNYWRREAEAYRDNELRARLHDAGLGLPAAETRETPSGIVLWLEDVPGRPGTQFELDDHAALARACGRWQAAPPAARPWSSRGFLRDHSTGRPVRWELLDDDAAWQRPLVRELWPDGLRAAWSALVAHRDELLALVERAPRTRCHLDLWVSNEIRRPDGTFTLLDWAFTGDGAIGEDIGNHIPDAVFDLFWPADRLPELAETCTGSYLEGLAEAGWRGDPDQVRRTVLASGVKYAWLLPLLLERASEEVHRAYHEQVDGRHLFRQRGLALAFVAAGCAEALRLS